MKTTFFGYEYSEYLVVYALINPIDNSIFYVGQTGKQMRTRLQLHRSEAKKRKYEVSKIIYKILSKGLNPEYIILEKWKRTDNRIRVKNINLLEGFWIREMVRQGHKLTNKVGLSFPSREIYGIKNDSQLRKFANKKYLSKAA